MGIQPVILKKIFRRKSLRSEVFLFDVWLLASIDEELGVLCAQLFLWGIHLIYEEECDACIYQCD